jgi:uncharacterized protein (TIGR03067 family)
MSVMKRAHARTSAIGLFVLTLLIASGPALCSKGAAARAVDDDRAQGEALKALEGTWVTKENEGVEAKFVFSGANLKASVNGMEYTCKVKLDPAAKPNATADLEIEDGPEDAKGKVSKAIYKLDGDKLKFCVSHPGKERPKEYEQVADESVLFDFTKQK